MSARLSVVIPAHDEERVLPRLLAGLDDPRLEVVVVANGCRDQTAHRARSAGQGIRVVEISQASKTAALNAGDVAATVFPRAYVDADVEVDAETLLALADALDGPGARVGSPAVALDLRGASAAVRAYYRVWQLSTFRSEGHIGSGVYAMSRAGRERFGAFPPVIGDDRFVQGLFSSDERVTVAQPFTVRPPRTLDALIRRGARISAGNRQLRDAGLAGHVPSAGGSLGGLVRRVAPRPTLWPAFVVYCGVQLRTRRLAVRKLSTEALPSWNRDESSRA